MACCSKVHNEMRRLSSDNIKVIKSLSAQGKGIKVIAARFRLRLTTVQRILN